MVDLGAAVGGEGEGTHAVLDLLLFQFRLVLSHPGDFGVGIHDRGNGAVVDVPVALLDVFHTRHRLLFGLVC